MKCARRGRWLRAALVAAFAMSATVVAETADGFSKTRELLDKWVETQQIVAKEREDWQLGKETLEHRIAILADEIADLEGKAGETGGARADAEAKRAGLAAEKRSIERAQSDLETTIVRMESKTRELLAVLPDPIRAKVKPLEQRIPAGAEADMPLAQRFQNVIGILNEVNRFNSEVTVVQEFRELSGGTTAQVDTLYVGLGAAYFVSPDGSAAGYGRPGTAGWTWVESADLAAPVQRAIRVLQNQDEPAYVPLPVEIQ